jgi:hemolysin D
MIQNKDIGFIRTGQRVAVKLEAFNFTDFGMVDGVVETISRDAIDMGGKNADPSAAKASASEGGGGGLVYAARIRLMCDMRNSKRSLLCDRVRPGMSVQAEIKTGSRRIIQYLLSPLARSVSEAGRER